MRTFRENMEFLKKNLCPAKGDLDLSGLVPPTVSAVLNNSLSNIYKITLDPMRNGLFRRGEGGRLGKQPDFADECRASYKNYMFDPF